MKQLQWQLLHLVGEAAPPGKAFRSRYPPHVAPGYRVLDSAAVLWRTRHAAQPGRLPRGPNLTLIV
jgi:hypothetical protein